MMKSSNHIPRSVCFLVLLLPCGLITGCMTGWDGKSYMEYRKITNELKAHTDSIKEAEFRRKQEAFYDSQFRTGK